MVLLKKKGSLDDCKQPNKWKGHVIYARHTCGLWEAGMCLGFGFKHILFILLELQKCCAKQLGIQGVCGD